MKNFVFHFALIIEEKTEGYVFLNEVPQNFNVNSLWTIAYEGDIKDPSILLDEYKFKAVELNEEITLTLKRYQNLIYFVQHPKFGKLLFAVEILSPISLQYVGKSKWITDKMKFLEIIPISVDRINDLCLNKGFFFVGTIDEEITNIE